MRRIVCKNIPNGKSFGCTVLMKFLANANSIPSPSSEYDVLVTYVLFPTGSGTQVIVPSSAIEFPYLSVITPCTWLTDKRTRHAVKLSNRHKHKFVFICTEVILLVAESLILRHCIFTKSPASKISSIV